ncbi:MAG: flippase-like domain-containing protein [Candidatus Obscuribacterales bacterium]|nr:flippase-like domain-containing protein [Candidatus Obscuribacterales bacterium]
MTMDNTGTTENISAAAPEAMAAPEPLAKKIIKQLIGLGLAAGLLYWCFHKTDFKQVWQFAQEMDLKFAFMVLGTALVSHIIRAWRWTLLLQPLSPGKRISLWNSFCAVMYGYAVNIVVPRGGELARLVAISKSESIPWAGVLPTMFIDRLLDIAMLVALIGLTITKLPPGILDARITGPAGILMCLATALGLVLLPFVGKIGKALLDAPAIKKLIPAGIYDKLGVLIVQFDLGTRSLTQPANLAVIAVSSVLIWVLYWANMYLMVFALHLEKLVDPAKSLMVFTISSVGVLVPTPGCVGSYHALTSQALQKIAGVSEAASLAYALISHLLCFIVIVCIPAAFCFIVQSAKSEKK